MEKVWKVVEKIVAVLVALSAAAFLLSPLLLVRACQKSEERFEREMERFGELLGGRDKGAENYYLLYGDRIEGENYKYSFGQSFAQAYRSEGGVVSDGDAVCLDSIADGENVYFLVKLPLYNGGSACFLCSTRLFSEKTEIVYTESFEQSVSGRIASAEGGKVFVRLGGFALLIDAATGETAYRAEFDDLYVAGEGFLWFSDDEGSRFGFLRAEGVVVQYPSLFREVPDSVCNGIAESRAAGKYCAQDIVSGEQLNEAEAAERTRYRRLADGVWADARAEHAVSLVGTAGEAYAFYDEEYCIGNSARLKDLSGFESSRGFGSTYVTDIVPDAALAYDGGVYLRVYVCYEETGLVFTDSYRVPLLFAFGENGELLSLAGKEGVEHIWRTDG